MSVHGSGAEIFTALYPRLLGSEWSNVADAVRGVHAARPVARSRGRVRVTNGPAPLARIVARLLWLPKPGDAVDTCLVVDAAAGEERWVRTFDGRRLDTRQYLGAGGELAERYGVFESRARLPVRGQTAASELKLHAARDFFYAVLFATLPFGAWPWKPETRAAPGR